MENTKNPLTKKGVERLQKIFDKAGLVPDPLMDIAEEVIAKHVGVISALGGSVMWPVGTFEEFKGPKTEFNERSKRFLNWLVQNRGTLRAHGHRVGRKRTISIKVRKEFIVREISRSCDALDVLEQMRKEIEDAGETSRSECVRTVCS